ncbi:MAG: tRNA (adenosine(37)-N6)-threonylcarbamoyltransferase complex dimerization subunit type 1 TsaB [Burkholderiales bacterium]
MAGIKFPWRMKILALETSTEYCSVALWRDGDVDAREARAGQRHSELLLPMVEALLERHGLGLKGLDGIAFGEGPGSFTGLRIGCGVTQGLAFGASLPVVGVSTLLALAEAARSGRAVCCLDARMGEIYHAAYARSDAGWEAVHAPSLCAPAQAPLLPAGAWTGCGSGFATHDAALRERYTGRLSAIMPEVFPHARDIARLAAREFEAGRTVSAEQAVPVYLRDRVALKTAER